MKGEAKRCRLCGRYASKFCDYLDCPHLEVTHGGSRPSRGASPRAIPLLLAAFGMALSAMLMVAVAARANLVVAGGQTVVSLWLPSDTPATIDSADPQAVELGVQFQSAVNGKVTGIRFYKASTNIGTHIGNLWTTDGTNLASVTFTGESASGWQQMLFSAPVAITAGTTYIASYHTTSGHYSADNNYFAASRVNGVLTAPATGLVSPGNGVFSYNAASVFPNQTFQASNYWVDVSFVYTPATQVPVAVSFPANPTGVYDTLGAGGFISAPQVATNTGGAFTGQLAITGQSDTSPSALTALSGPTVVAARQITPSDDGTQTVTVQATGNGTSVSGTLTMAVAPPPADPVSALLPPDRDAYANWKMAGLLSVGGIPSRTTQCGATLSPSGGSDVAQIQNAINACPAGQVVALAAGTFNTNSACININKGVVLRGAGAGLTTLLVTNGAVLGSVNPGSHAACVVSLGGDAAISNVTALAGDGVQGSFSVTVSNTAGIHVGSLVLIDELALAQSMPDCCFNGGTGRVWAMPDYRVEWNAHSPTVAFFDSADFSNDNNFTTAPSGGDACAYSVRCGGVNEELHLVTAVSGNAITFDSPLTLSYRVANVAQMHVYSSAGLVQNAGLENLKVQGGDQGNITFSSCVYCWVKGVDSTIWLNAGGIAFYTAAFRDQAEMNWIHNAAWPVNGGGGYAVNHTFGSSENYFVNNIVMFANKVEVVRASGSGTVVAYNYMDDGYINGSDGWIETGLNCSHLAGSHHVLHEGNYSWNTDNDFTHGSVSHCAFFRNYLTGFRAPFTALDGTPVDDSAGCCGPQRAVGDHAYSYWDSFVGNVAGEPGKMAGWKYRCAAGGADSGCAPAVFNIGWNDTSVAGSLSDGTMALSYPNSPTGGSATITGPGCVSSGSNCTPIVDGNYDYLTNSIQWASNDTSHTLPPSFYLSGKPAFFTGTASTWPWVNPTGSPQVFTNPAKARWDAGTPFVQP